MSQSIKNIVDSNPTTGASRNLMKSALFRRPSKRDPFEDRPTRNPGESLEGAIEDLLWDKVVFWLFLALMLGLISTLEWWRWYFDLAPSPGLFTAVTVIFALTGVYRVNRLWPKLQQMKRGLRGERYVGDFLQTNLPRLGYRVIHDVQDEQGNIDHVLIGPAGIFCIETKTRGKPAGRNEIGYDGTTVTINGLTPERDPIAQARACAAGLGRILKEFTGQTVSPRAVVLYPGWWIQPQPRGVDVWVLNEKALPKFLQKEPMRLSSEQIDMFADAILRFVRQTRK